MDSSVKMLNNIINAPIVYLSGRKFPAIAIQGDSLSNLFNQSLSLLKSLDGKIDPEAFLELLEHTEQLESYLSVYEAVLAEKEIELPYADGLDVNNTKKYQTYWNEY